MQPEPLFDPNEPSIFDEVDEAHDAAASRGGGSLAEHPDRGRPASGGPRELTIVPPSVISHRVRSEKVRILRVRHGRQRS